MHSACILGWGHTPFGRHTGHTLQSLLAEAVAQALAHARVPAEAIDAVYVAHYNGGLVDDAFVAGLPALACPALRHVPATRLENACASGSAALYAGMQRIAADQARHVLVVGAEKMTAAAAPDVTQSLARASYWPEEGSRGTSFPALFAGLAQAYAAAYGDPGAAMARIAAKNHAHGALNPLAHLRRPLDFDFCHTVSEANPLVAPPLRRTDCSLVSDGAAALVLGHREHLAGVPRAVGFRAARQVNDYLPLSLRPPLWFEAPGLAWRQACADAGITLADLSFAEVHDCFTIAELMSYEAMGLAAPGQGHRCLEDGTVQRDGRLPVNVSGGLKAKGHPIGATGVSMHVMAAMQLCGEAGEMQLVAPDLGAVFNMGGTAVANYVSILQRLR
ncbi:thiolase domain-containing protein [Verticiella sediminum]|uniref:Thiolase domain-containing protein n=1 Tax=Verticiella sediminum TaxID=1247510 RepID=A0A556AED4_9BURK|nr:thiolase domain-containing protein [Verticiella sediminum]TSH91225.1 thiolase domain-containing protein [Verticiella sediminum]